MKNCEKCTNDWFKTRNICYECMLGMRNNFKKKEDVKMSKVTIEYEEIKNPIKTIKAKTIMGLEVEFNKTLDGELGIVFREAEIARVLNKETAIELVAALNELVNQL